MSQWRWLFFAFLTVAGGALGPAQAAERWVLPLDGRSWQTLKVPGARENQFVVQDNILQVQSQASVSFRYFQLPASIKTPAKVSWRWRVDAHSALTSQTAKGRDDRPLAVHIWFDDAGNTSLFGGVGSLLGYPKVGHLLTYVWGAQERAGSVLPNPYYDKGRMVVLVGRDGAKGQWHSVQRNIVADFQKAFGKAPDLSTLRYIAISADSDDLSGHSTAAINAISFQTP